MCLENAASVHTGAPLSVNARRHGGPDQRVVAIAHVLNLVVVPDLFHVRPVVKLPADAVQHYLAVFQILRMRTVYCIHTNEAVANSRFRPRRAVTVYYLRKLVAWHSGRKSVSGRRTFPVLRSTCS